MSLRIQSVDTIRLGAIAAIIAIHTTPFHIPLNTDFHADYYGYLSLLINQLARFAVPFFFVISGYFWGRKIHAGENALEASAKTSSRLLLLFSVWSCVYLLPLNVQALHEHGIVHQFASSYQYMQQLFQQPLTLAVQGSKVHLWFLIALDFNTRNGPFFSLLPFVIGYTLAARRTQHNWFMYGVIVLMVSTLVHFCEIYWLWQAYDTSPRQDYVFATLGMGVGTCLVALSNHRLLQSRVTSELGKLTLGVYAIHYIFVDMLDAMDDQWFSPVWEIGYVLVVLVISLSSAYAMSRHKVLKRLVM